MHETFQMDDQNERQVQITLDEISRFHDENDLNQTMDKFQTAIL